LTPRVYSTVTRDLNAPTTSPTVGETLVVALCGAGAGTYPERQGCKTLRNPSYTATHVLNLFRKYGLMML
jgi:hypothetical protein